MDERQPHVPLGTTKENSALLSCIKKQAFSWIFTELERNKKKGEKEGNNKVFLTWKESLSWGQEGETHPCTGV